MLLLPTGSLLFAVHYIKRPAGNKPDIYERDIIYLHIKTGLYRPVSTSVRTYDAEKCANKMTRW